MTIRSAARHIRDVNLIIPGWLESAMLRSQEDSGTIDLPLVAIVGPPRVGSTLMYQLLVSQFRSIWFDNFQHTFLRYPYLAYWISQRLIPKNTSSFRSDHGFVNGIGGLSEGNFFWPYWFDMNLKQNLEPAPKSNKTIHIRSVFNRMYEDNNLPFFNSFNAHAFYLTALKHHFNKLVIINMRREPVANAVSLLRGRKEFCKNTNEWWSIKPDDCSSNKENSAYEQISCQILKTYQAIKSQRHCLPLPIIDIHYEQLCESPHETLESIQAFCQEAGIVLERAVHPLPMPNLQIRGPRREEAKDATHFSVLFDKVNWEELWS